MVSNNIEPAEKQTVWAFAGLALLSLSLIGGCWDAAFTARDDDRYVVRHPIVTGQESIFSAFANTSLELYIPTVIISYRIDRLLFYGLKSTSLETWAPGCRAMSLLYHILAGFILWRWVLPKLGLSALASTFVAGIFLLHPSQCEAVCWIAERKTVLAGLFSAATLALYFRLAESSMPRAGLFVAMVLAFALALMSKITALGILPVLVCWELLLANRPFSAAPPAGGGETTAAPGPSLLRGRGQALLRLAVLAVIGLILVYVNWRMASDQFGIRMGANVFESLLTDVEILARYLQVLFWPTLSSPYYEMLPITSPFSARFAIAAAGFFGPVILTIWLPKSSEDRRRAAFGWLWFVGAMSLALNLAAQPEYMHDRYMYFSLPGAALAIVMALKGLAQRVSLPASRSLCAGETLILCVVLALLAFDVGSDWGGEIGTFERAVKKQPGSTFSQGYLGSVLGVAANVSEAKSPELAHAWREQAVGHLQAACMAADANYNIRRAQFWVARALILEKLGRIDEAREVLRKLPEHAAAQNWTMPGDLNLLKKAKEKLFALECEDPDAR